jgi:hypothetical protein
MAGNGAVQDELPDHRGSWPLYGDRPTGADGPGDHTPSVPGRRRWDPLVVLLAAAVILGAGFLLFGGRPTVPEVVPAPASSVPQRAPSSGPRWAPVDAALTAGLVRVLVTANVEADGIVMTRDGVVATSYARLVGLNGSAAAIDAVELRVVADGGMPMRADIIGFDASRDIAVLRVPGYTPASVARLGAPAKQGERLTVLDDQGGDQPIVGHPVTVGALAQRCSRVGAAMIGHPSGFQFSLDLATAEPGGAIVRDDGSMAGLYFGGDSNPRCGVPIADVAEVVRQVVAGSQTATIRVGPPGGLGVQLYAPDKATCPEVVSIDAVGSLANAAGVGLHDTLTRVGGRSLCGPGLGAFGPDGVIRSLEPGRKVSIEWRSGGTTHRAEVRIGEGAQPRG